MKKTGDDRSLTILVTKDRNSKAVVVYKGRGEEETISQAVDNIKNLGHRNKFILKTDNEPALTSLRDGIIETLASSGVQILVEPPPVEESQSNGAIENGVRLVKEMVRVHMISLESRIQGEIPTFHPIMTWIVPHAANCITKYLVGHDGKTAYQRLWGKTAQEEILEIGERIFWRKRKSAMKDLDSRYHPGIWLGRVWGSSTHIVWDGQKAIEVYGIQRVPKDERWSRADIEAIIATPWDWEPQAQQGEQRPLIPERLDSPLADAQQDTEPGRPHSMHIQE